MLRRHATTTGPVTTSQTGVILSITNLPSTSTTLTMHVDGIEMVYCLPGDFYVGDGDGAGANFTSDGSPSRFANGTSLTPSPLLVTSANETALSTFYEMSTSGSAATTVANVPIAFPKGQYGFYMMKYEITEGLYTEMLNTIASAAQNAHYTSSMGVNYRGTVNSNGSNLYTCIRPDRAMNQLGWGDFSAFLDWACLRPMTELEFEKSCRGSGIAAVIDEYVWGGISANQGTAFNNPPIEDGTETMTGGNAIYAITANSPINFTTGDGGSGPVRAGIFATAASIRVTAGAGYYGAMDLGGNVKEWVVALSSTVANDVFTRRWGNGDFGGTNDNDVTSWPAATTATTANVNTNIIGQKGGGCDDLPIFMQTSARNGIYTVTANANNARGTYGYGGRGAR